MPPVPTRFDGMAVDLSGRLYSSTTVAGSPATNGETIVASVTIPPTVAINQGVYLFGYVAFTVGTNGTGTNVKLRHTDASGTTLAATGLVTAVAANLGEISVVGVDLANLVPGQTYVMTLTVAAGSAISTVSAVCLIALVV